MGCECASNSLTLSLTLFHPLNSPIHHKDEYEGSSECSYVRTCVQIIRGRLLSVQVHLAGYYDVSVHT